LGIAAVFSSKASFSGEAFEPEVVEIMSDAYGRALRHLHDKGQPDVVLELIANRIIRLTREGERNSEALARRSLVALGLTHDI
jgi:hypothetical protein